MGSSNTNQHINAGASDAALAVSGSSVVSKDNGISVGGGSTIATGTRVVGNTTNSTITFNQGDPALAETFAKTVKDLSDANHDSLSELLQNQTRANLPAATDLPAPGDEVPADKPKSDWLFWGGILAGLGLLYWLFKR